MPSSTGPRSHLMVVPLQATGMAGERRSAGRGAQSPDAPQSGALVLRIDDSGITETGFVTQPDTANTTGYPGYPPIERSLIIGQTLWTISTAGAMASDLTTLRQQEWIPFAGPAAPPPTDEELAAPHHLPARQHLPRHVRQLRRRPAAFPAAPAGCAHASHGGAACHRDRTCPLIGLAALAGTRSARW